ncbi:MAG TPA: hypothetical protein VJH69_03670 [Candidatus Paceibacterota bacterium]
MNAKTAVILYLQREISGLDLDRQVERAVTQPESRPNLVYWLQVVMTTINIGKIGAVKDEHLRRLDQFAEEVLDELVSQKSR